MLLLQAVGCLSKAPCLRDQAAGRPSEREMMLNGGSSAAARPCAAAAAALIMLGSNLSGSISLLGM